MAKKLPGTPIQDIPLKTIHKGLKNKPKENDTIKSKQDWANQVFSTGFESIEVPKPVITSNILTTGVVAESYEAGIEHLFSFVHRRDYSGYSYALLMKEDDESFTSYERTGQPCWGSLRTYGEKSTRPNDPKPGDLLTPQRTFPATGKVEALGVSFNGYLEGVPKKEMFNRFLAEFVFNKEESPWSSILKNVEMVIKNDLFVGCVFKDCHIDPTVLAQFLRAFASFYVSSAMTSWCNLMDAHPEIDAKVAFLEAHKGMYTFPGISKRVHLESFFKAKPFDLSNGGTLHDREDYNRPDRDYVFGGKNNVGVSISSMTLAELQEAYDNIMRQDDANINVA